MADIAVSVTRANELLRTDRLTTRVFQRECRDISTRVRKLVLPNDEVLLKQCFVPTIHPLRMPELTENPSILTQAIGNITIEYTEGEGTVPQKETIPSQHEHETLVGPLYGLRRSKELTYKFEELFDWSATPLPLRKWLNIKVLQIDDVTITAERMLRMMANKEGAHSQLDEMATSNPALPVPIHMGVPDDESYRKANVINFSGISFVQIFTFLVGFYLAKRMRATLQHIPDGLTPLIYSRDAWDDILKTPPQLATPELKVDRPFNMGAIIENVGDAGQTFKMIGDYQTPSRTVVKIP